MMAFVLKMANMRKMEDCEGRNEKNGCCGQFLARLCRITVKLESKKQVFMDEN
jgi:hypothetical protein